MSWVILKCIASHGALTSAPCVDPTGRIFVYSERTKAEVFATGLRAKAPPATTFITYPVEKLGASAISVIAAQERNRDQNY